MKKRVVMLLLVSCLLTGQTPITALAEETVAVSENMTVSGQYTYLDESGVEQVKDAIVMDATMTTWTDGWYVVKDEITMDSRVTVSGDVHLILANGAKLEVNGGIGVEGENKFSVYGQSIEPSVMGQLVSKGKKHGDAGIGCGRSGIAGTITINGGMVTTKAADNGTGIGSGLFAEGGLITINGGVVNSTGSQYGAGIGTGEAGKGGNIIINGGTINASSASGAGIGGGSSTKAENENEGLTVTIHGGNITARSSSGGAAIGAGMSGTIESVCIHGGNITASTGYGGAAIGAGGSGQVKDVTITGGIVNATGGIAVSGIGGGDSRTNKKVKVDRITISGGTIIAQGGQYCDYGIGSEFQKDACVFSTGETGNVVIITSEIEFKEDISQWRGVIFQGTEGLIYGDSATPSESFEVQEGKTLTIANGQTLVIQEGKTLTNNGTICVKEGGELVINGTFVGNEVQYEADKEDIPEEPESSKEPEASEESKIPEINTSASSAILGILINEYGCDMKDIVKVYSEIVKSTDILVPGWELMIPQYDAEKNVIGSSKHVVTKGDSVWSISKRYGCTCSDIVSFNSVLLLYEVNAFMTELESKIE